MHKIKKVSRYFRLLFQALFILLPLLDIYFWWQIPTGTVLSFEPAFIFGLNHSVTEAAKLALPLTLTSKWLGFTFCLIPLFFTQGILYLLVRLFRHFENGEIFIPQNVAAIRNIGILMLIKQCFQPILGGLLTGTMTWFNPPGKHLIAISIDTTNLGLILTSLLIILISWIVAEGYKLYEEQQYTV
jgi:hypothetical protein